MILVIAGNDLLIDELQPFFIGFLLGKDKPEEMIVKKSDVKFLNILVFILGMLIASIMMNSFKLRLKQYIYIGFVFELLAIISVFFWNSYRKIVFTYTCLFSFGSGIIHLTCL